MAIKSPLFALKYWCYAVAPTYLISLIISCNIVNLLDLNRISILYFNIIYLRVRHSWTCFTTPRSFFCYPTNLSTVPYHFEHTKKARTIKSRQSTISQRIELFYPSWKPNIPQNEANFCLVKILQWSDIFRTAKSVLYHSSLSLFHKSIFMEALNMGKVIADAEKAKVWNSPGSKHHISSSIRHVCFSVRFNSCYEKSETSTSQSTLHLLGTLTSRLLTFFCPFELSSAIILLHRSTLTAATAITITVQPQTYHLLYFQLLTLLISKTAWTSRESFNILIPSFFMFTLALLWLFIPS